MVDAMTATLSRRRFLAGLGRSGAALATGSWLHSLGYAAQAQARGPARALVTQARHRADFDRRLTEAEKRWQAAMAPYKGLKVVTYHRSWPNFAEAFGLDVIGYVEPKPGIPLQYESTIDGTYEPRRIVE